MAKVLRILALSNSSQMLRCLCMCVVGRTLVSLSALQPMKVEILSGKLTLSYMASISPGLYCLASPFGRAFAGSSLYMGDSFV